MFHHHFIIYQDIHQNTIHEYCLTIVFVKILIPNGKSPFEQRLSFRGASLRQGVDVDMVLPKGTIYEIFAVYK